MENLLVVPEEQSAAALDMKSCIAAVRDAFIASERKEMYPGERIAMKLGNEKNAGQWLTAVCTRKPYFGYKFSAVFPDNKKYGMPCDQSTISLFSALNGKQLALIGANYLTALKTGAGAAVATDLAANPDACRLGVIGTGVQAYTQVLAIQEVRELQELRIYSRSKENVDNFAEKVRAAQNRPYRILRCEDSSECVAGSDIVCTATPSHTPVFDAKALQPGTHLNAIGSFTPFMQEIDEETVAKAAFVVTEHVDGLWEAAGDILIPYHKGRITREKVRGSVGELLTGKKKGRRDAGEITIYESVGSCVLDLALAIKVYEKLRPADGEENG